MSTTKRKNAATKPVASPVNIGPFYYGPTGRDWLDDMLATRRSEAVRETPYGASRSAVGLRCVASAGFISSTGEINIRRSKRSDNPVGVSVESGRDERLGKYDIPHALGWTFDDDTESARSFLVDVFVGLELLGKAETKGIRAVRDILVNYLQPDKSE